MTLGGSGGNIIADNTGAGVQVGASSADSTAVSNTITGNAIFGNATLGIDLSGSGTFIANDSQGHDGPNNLQDYPVLNGAFIDSTGLLWVTYSDPTDSNSAYPVTVDFYLADANGQGQKDLGAYQDSFETAGNGTVDLGNAASLGVTSTSSLVAAATDGEGNTSEFSPAITVGQYVVTNTNDSGAGSYGKASPMRI